jgi:uncharacterized protein YukE
MPADPMEYLWPGIVAAQAIHTSAKLCIPDLLASRPKTLAQVASSTGADPPALGHLLRALWTLDVFAAAPQGSPVPDGRMAARALPKKDAPSLLLSGRTGARDFTGRPRTNTIRVNSSQRRLAWSAVGPRARRHFVFLYPFPSWKRGLSMSQAIVNPEELRRFAARLKQFNNEMIGQLTTMHGQLAGLSQTWRDREHDKFVEEFEQTLQVMKRFTEATNQHIPFLLRKAERIEEYLQQR